MLQISVIIEQLVQIWYSHKFGETKTINLDRKYNRKSLKISLLKLIETKIINSKFNLQRIFYFDIQVKLINIE